MTVEQFMKETSGYYGQWDEFTGKYVMQWLRRYKGNLGQLFSELLKSFSNRWGKAPGIAELEEAAKIARDRKERAIEYTGVLQLEADPVVERDSLTPPEERRENLRKVYETIGNAAKAKELSEEE